MQLHLDELFRLVRHEDLYLFLDALIIVDMFQFGYCCDGMLWSPNAPLLSLPPEEGKTRENLL